MDGLKDALGWLDRVAGELPFPLWWIVVGTIVVLWLGYLIGKWRGGK